MGFGLPPPGCGLALIMNKYHKLRNIFLSSKLPLVDKIISPAVSAGIALVIFSQFFPACPRLPYKRIPNLFIFYSIRKILNRYFATAHYVQTFGVHLNFKPSPRQQHLSGLGFRPEKVDLSLSQLYKKDKKSLDVTLKPHLMLIEARTSPETPALGTANTEGSAA